MPEGVVDDLEAVEVEEEQRKVPPAAGAASSRSLKCSRFGRPVSPSWRAMWAMRSSARLRSVASTTVPS